MKTTSLLLVAALALASCAAPTTASAPGAQTFTMSAETAAHCQAGGGCHPITVPDLQQALQSAFQVGAQRGYQAGQQACGKLL